MNGAQLDRLATHEAAHACACAFLGHPLHVVSTIAKEHYAGVAVTGSNLTLTDGEKGRLGTGLSVLLPARVRRSFECSAMVSLAGPTVYEVYWPADFDEGSYRPDVSDDVPSTWPRSRAAALTPRETEMLEQADTPAIVDLESAMELAELLSRGAPMETFLMLRAETRVMVESSKFRRALDVVVPELVEHRVLPGRRVRELLKKEGVRQW